MGYSEIKNLMKSKGIRQCKLADMLDLSQSCFSLKLSGARPLSMDEARFIQQYLCIPDEKFVMYFYDNQKEIDDNGKISIC